MGNPGTLTQDRNEPEHSDTIQGFFVQFRHKTSYAAMENHHFFTITCHRQIY